jgi:hemolysin III
MTRGELIADCCIHVIGVTAGGVAVAVLMAMALPRGSALLTASLMIYGCGLIAMLGCSAAYNIAARSAPKEFLRRLDHAAIFVMIAGTYTPFVLLKIRGAWGMALLVFVWLGAAMGVVVKLLYPRRFERLSTAFYLLLGWSALVAIKPLISALPPPAVTLLGSGGLFYSVGVIFHARKALAYQNAIWHAFVLAGAGCHYAAVLGYVALA